MAASSTGAGFTNAEWAVWEPLIEAVRPRGKTLPHELRQTIVAIFWRHQNGARWRAIPAELGPWWRTAQLFIRWAQHGAWERLLGLAQERAGGLELSLAFLDGTNVRAHAKAEGAPKKGEQALVEISVKSAISQSETLPWSLSRRLRHQSRSGSRLPRPGGFVRARTRAGARSAHGTRHAASLAQRPAMGGG